MKSLFTIFFSLLFFGLSAQVGIETTTPEAALDIDSANNGVLIPRIALLGNNDTTTIVNPQGGALATSTLVYNTTAIVGANAIAAGFVYWNGSVWAEVGAAPIGDNLGNHTATANLNMTNRQIDNVSFLDFQPGVGNGLRFWSSNAYAINMGNTAEYQYGPVTDYSIKSNMSNTAARGWTWGADGVAPIAALNTQGNMQIAGSLAVSNSLNVDNNTLFVDAGTNEVGLATPNPTASLSVNGTANKTGGGAWAVFSDKRLKKNVSKYDEGLDLIMKVNPVNFSYNENYISVFGGDKEITDKIYQGVIAQELQKIAPDMVRVVNKAKNNASDLDGGTTASKGGEFLEVDPSKFTYALINAVQEQQKEIEALKKMVQQLLQKK